MKSIVAIGLVLACYQGPVVQKVNTDIRDHIPAIAKIGNLTFGFMTTEEFEDVVGKGMVITGAHPQGARLWRTPDGMIVHTDGFEMRMKNGHIAPIVERLAVERDFHFGVDPKTIKPIFKVNLLRIAGLWPGQSRSHVETLLGIKLAQKCGKWQEVVDRKGRLVVSDRLTYSIWKLSMSFKNCTLTGFELLVDQ